MSKIFINPPPADKRCERCGVHIDELIAFGKAGDPLVGDFNGLKLVKTFRSVIEEDMPEYDEILDYISKNSEDMAEEKFGESRVSSAMFYDQLKSTVGASWECRNCIVN